ncbi:MAG: hypothetical protein JSV66_02060, partial [Trueperaceae bacterium]
TAQVDRSAQVTQKEERNMTARKGLAVALVTALVFSALAWDDPGVITEQQVSQANLTEHEEFMALRQEYKEFLIAKQQQVVLTEAEEMWQLKREYRQFLIAQSQGASIVIAEQ